MYFGGLFAGIAEMAIYHFPCHWEEIPPATNRELYPKVIHPPKGEGIGFTMEPVRCRNKLGSMLIKLVRPGIQIQDSLRRQKRRLITPQRPPNNTIGVKPGLSG
jgi:hypothetical protein